MAENEGFEPPRRFLDLSVFKTDPFNRTWVFLRDIKNYNNCTFKCQHLNLIIFKIMLNFKKNVVCSGFSPKKEKPTCTIKKNIIYFRGLMFKTSACPSGGTGRRTGLKILRDLTLVPVQVRPRAPIMH